MILVSRRDEEEFRQSFDQLYKKHTLNLLIPHKLETNFYCYKTRTRLHCTNRKDDGNCIDLSFIGFRLGAAEDV